MIWPDPTHWPTHPPNYTSTLGWGSLHRFQIFKQNWNISISSSAIEFRLILGVPPSGGWGVVRGCPPHMCTCRRMCVWHHREFPWIPPMGAAICMKLSCLPHMHVHVCACVHVHVCGGHPPTTPHPYPPTPTPQSCREPKTPKFNNSWTNRDNSILFEDSLPLNIPELIWTIVDHPRHPHPPAPPPRAKETQIKRITITLEQIEIIQFCLKIWESWTLLHTYRLDLMCRWGVSYYKWHFYVFDPKKCSCDPPIKKISCFCTGSH